MNEFKKLREDAGLTLHELAVIIGYSVPTINGLELKNDGSKRLREKILSVLKPKTETVITESVKHQTPKNHGGPYWGMSCTAPILSWASAGTSHKYEDQGDDPEGPRIATDCKDANCYALSIKGDSMSPVFLDGDVVVLEPNREARHGDLVVAKTTEDEVYFKRLEFSRDLKLVRLVSYNPNYPVMEFKKQDFHFLHPVYSVTRYMGKNF